MVKNIGCSYSEAWNATEDDQHEYKLGWQGEGLSLLPFNHETQPFYLKTQC